MFIWTCKTNPVWRIPPYTTIYQHYTHQVAIKQTPGGGCRTMARYHGACAECKTQLWGDWLHVTGEHHWCSASLTGLSLCLHSYVCFCFLCDWPVERDRAQGHWGPAVSGAWVSDCQLLLQLVTAAGTRLSRSLGQSASWLEVVAGRAWTGWV